MPNLDALQEEEEEEEVWTIKVRCTRLGPDPFSVPVQPSAPLSQLVEFVNERLAVTTTSSSTTTVSTEVGLTKLFKRGGGMLALQCPVSQHLRDGDTVLLVFSTRQEVDHVTASSSSSASSAIVRSVEEEDALEERRRHLQALAAASTEQDAVYKFCRFKVCDRFVQPHPFEAMRLLERLAGDPAIKRLMRAHKWTVGGLEEMDPKADMIALRKQSEDGACVLGYNENAGHRIFLRLRNDAETAFRSYNSLVNTLLHELAHNVHGPHDEHFWALFAKLKTEYLKFHQVERGVTSGAKLDLTDAQVMREIRTQGAGNAALEGSERAAALNLASAANRRQQPVQLPPPSRLGAANSRARLMERDKLASAAEKRFSAAAAPVAKKEEELDYDCACGHPPAAPPAVKPASLPPPAPPPLRLTEPSPVGYDEESTSARERQIRQAVITLCRLQRVDAARLLHTILRNAASGEAKFRQVKTTGERFRATLREDDLQLLWGVGFTRTTGGDMMITLPTVDPGLLVLARALLEDSGLVQV